MHQRNARKWCWWVAGDIYAATLHSAVFLRAVKMGVKC